MEYSALVNSRVRQEAQRCLRLYHEAHAHRARAAPPSPTVGADEATAPCRPCWRFYAGQTRALPGVEYVDDLLALGGETRRGNSVGAAWRSDVLEHRHDYVQWLFPLRERGVNGQAPLLTTSDAADMAADGLVMARVLQAFRMMLRFYGMCVTYTFPSTAPPTSSSSPPSTPAVAGDTRVRATLRRTADAAEWGAQYANLRRRAHNYLRISRILQFVGEVGLEPLKLGWLEFLVHEVVPTDAPLSGACHDSLFFWLETPYDAADRHRLQQLVVDLASRTSHGASQTSDASGPVVVVEGLVVPRSLDAARLEVRAAAATPVVDEAAPKRRRL
ncbi:Opioid growth factor receptor (OGFr) conserved region containing protein [Novymonas esmeraldas]|uniref:Opioid growth factor receptor (OGFr) conserved region containing protein n=1 Tax=Novymonas esmeraldas TaxID=1808958 RepID=A0AAW0ESL4_9TRYP